MIRCPCVIIYILNKCIKKTVLSLKFITIARQESTLKISRINTEIIEMNKHRYLLSVNDEGYIDNIIYGDYMLDGYDRLPEDISDGYYYINKGKIKKDKRKEEENGIFV
jgi:hypothetical protein